MKFPGLVAFSLMLFFSLPLAFPMSRTALAEETLHFSASVGMPFSNAENSGFEDRLVKTLFGRLGYQVEVHFVPAERALRSLNEGIDDGALGRVGGILTKYESIRQIPEKAFDRDFMVFTRSVDFVPSGWESLAPYNVGIITGWKILENNIEDAKSLVKAKDGAQLFELLAAGRVDVVIYNRWGGLQHLKETHTRGVKLLEPPLVSAAHYFNLNKKYENLLEDAAKVLRDMKEDGAYQRIFDETLAPLARD